MDSPPTLSNVAAQIKSCMWRAFLDHKTRLFWVRNFKEPFGSVQEVEDAFEELTRAKVLDLQATVHGDCGHSIYYADGVGPDLFRKDPTVEEKFLYSIGEDLEVPYEDWKKGDLNPHLECFHCGEDQDLMDAHLTFDWALHPDFLSELNSYHLKAQTVEYHVDRGAKPWEVVLTVAKSDPSEDVPGRPVMGATEATEVIRLLMEEGRLVEDLETGTLYVAKWCPKTIARVQAHNQTFKEKKL